MNFFQGVYFENNHEYTLRKNSLKLIGLLGTDSNRVENTHSKKFFEVISLFRTFSGVYILKLIMSTPFEKIH